MIWSSARPCCSLRSPGWVREVRGAGDKGKMSLHVPHLCNPHDLESLLGSCREDCQAATLQGLLGQPSF